MIATDKNKLHTEEMNVIYAKLIFFFLLFSRPTDSLMSHFIFLRYTLIPSS